MLLTAFYTLVKKQKQLKYIFVYIYVCIWMHIYKQWMNEYTKYFVYSGILFCLNRNSHLDETWKHCMKLNKLVTECKCCLIYLHKVPAGVKFILAVVEAQWKFSLCLWVILLERMVEERSVDYNGPCKST